MADLAEMPRYRSASRISAGWAGIVLTMVLQLVLFAWYFGKLDERISNIQSDILQLKYEIHKDK